MIPERRKFLQGAAMSAATLAASRLATGESEKAHLPTLPGVKWDKAPCRFCGTGCHVMVGTKGGKIVSIAGDAKAPVNQGLLCMKGYHVGLVLYGKDRLKKPLLRKGNEFQEISWERAISVIADRILADPKGFALYGSGQWTIPEGYAAQKFMKGGLSSNHIDPNARLCMASAVTGFLATYGVDEPAGCYEDLDVADVVIAWGNNPAEMHPVLFSRVIDRRARGEKVEFIDLTTRRTRTSGHSDRTMIFAPQSDLAIVNCLMKLLVDEGKYDKKFVEAHCAFKGESNPRDLHGRKITFEEFKKGLSRYTLEYTAKLSGVSVADLRYLAALFADPKKRITSLWCMGMNQHTEGTAINTQVHGLHLLSGHFGKPGDAPTSLTGQPSACGTAREVGTMAHALPGGRLVANSLHRKQSEAFWNVPEGRINPNPGYHTVKMWEQFSTPKEKGGDISTIWVQVTNPGQSLPNTNKLFYPSRKDPDKFLIVSDVYPTETTRYADLILPSALWVEKNGMFGNSERRTHQWFKQVEPPGEARDDCWQLIAVARELYERGFQGMKDKDANFLFRIEEGGKEVPVYKWQHYYDANVDRALFEEYRKFTTLKHKDLAPYEEYEKARGLRWPVVQQKNGSWRETRFRFSEFDDPYVKKGKGIDFYHSPTEDGRAQIWLRDYIDPPEMPDEKFPFWLCTGRVIEHWHTGTMTMRIPQLRQAMPNAYVELNREDAQALGVRNGDTVLLETRRGKLKLPAWIDGRGDPPRGSVFVPFFDERLLINQLTLEAHCPFSKEPDYKKCAVKVSRA